jgi:molybdopterin-containing oxidoreductase family iron-sulfur binding subunit
MRISAASLALAGLGACTRQPREEIVPYVRQPDDLTPGRPQYYATAMALGGEAFGLLVRSDEGRPTKIEGNPNHPATRGRSSVQMQAALLNLYDPARSQMVWRHNEPATWEDFLGALIDQRARWQQRGGQGVRLLTRRIASPTLQEQIAAFLQKYPQAKWHEHDLVASDVGRVHLDRCDVVVSFGCDLFGPGANRVSAVTDFAKRRAREQTAPRLYVAESMPSLTGAMADHRRVASPSALRALAAELRAALTGSGTASDPWVAAVARELSKHRGHCVVLAGENDRDEQLRADARAINDLLGNTGPTIEYSPAPAANGPASLAELAKDLHAGAVDALFVLGGNPAYDAPADLDFAGALAKVPFLVHHGLYRDETARRSAWHIPEAHALETWSDVRGRDGSYAITQPLIDPLYAGRSAHELLLALIGGTVSTPYDIVRAAWEKRNPTANTDAAWRKLLNDGVTAPTASQSQPPTQTTAPAPAGPTPRTVPPTGLELIIRLDPHVLDGRFAENAWLQELPKPFTRLTWENAAHLSRRTATKLGLEHGDVVELAYRGRTLRAPVWILPGHADECVTIDLGHGREGIDSGFNAFALQTSDAPWGGPGLEIRKTDETHIFSSTHGHQRMEGRDLVRVETLGRPRPERHEEPPPARDESLFPNVAYDRPSWGMVIDLNACIGCGACTIACQAENNIPVVGREQVIREREMHWIRVDHYFEGPDEAPQLLHQPVPCMHCENAPCEVVCPVAATVHDHEGLNVMVYNRCIGTRYCSNNCPYKVRRFNFLAYNSQAPQLALMRNPHVSVRMRGVMEKCTYCLQRISAARIAANNESRAIRDGEVIPACAQACPADAITFGDIGDPESRVRKQRASSRHYALLAGLNTRPRTTYLARVRNPNPELA